MIVIVIMLAASIVLLIAALTQIRRANRALRELEARERAREAEAARQRQRDTLQQMIADFGENCHIEAYRHAHHPRAGRTR
jgi:type II secretory pathway pseudopilin PulG